MQNENRRRFGLLEIVFILMAAGYLFYAFVMNDERPAEVSTIAVTEVVVSTSQPTQFPSPTGDAPKEQGSLMDLTTPASSELPGTIADPLERAARYAELEDYASAIVHYSEVLLEQPGNAQALVGRAQAYNTLNMYDEAVQDFVRIPPDDRTAEQHVMLADVHYTIGDNSAALFNYNRALEINNTVAAAYYGRGRIYADRENFALATDDFERAITLDDANRVYATALADLYLAQGQFPEAAEQYSAVLEAAPFYVDARIGRARVRLELEDYVSAVEDLNTAVLIDPTNVEALYTRGTALLRSGETSAAIFNFNAALAIEPDNHTALLGRAGVYVQQEQYDTAEQDLMSVLQDLPDRAQAWLLLGDLYVATERPEDAAEAYRNYMSFTEDIPAQRAVNYVGPIATEEAAETEK